MQDQQRLLPIKPAAYYLSNKQKKLRYKCIKLDGNEDKIQQYVMEACQLHNKATTNNIRKFNKDAYCILTTQQYNNNKNKFQDHRLYSNQDLSNFEFYNSILETMQFEDEDGFVYQPLPLIGVPSFDIFEEANQNESYFEDIKKNNSQFFHQEQKKENPQQVKKKEQIQENKEVKEKQKGVNSLKDIFTQNSQKTPEEDNTMEKMMQNMNLKKKKNESNLNQESFKKSNQILQTNTKLEKQNADKDE